MLRPCAIEGCDGVAGVPGTARGWCSSHYSRWQNHGDPLAGGRRRTVPWEPICRLCGERKSETEFLVRRESGRRRTECRSCQSASALVWARANKKRRQIAQKKYQERNTDERAERYLMRTYSVTRDQAKSIRGEGSCAICQKSPKRLHVDHDHANGSIRGLLCKNCNHGLGMFRDDISLIQGAVAYLAHPPGIGLISLA